MNNEEKNRWITENVLGECWHDWKRDGAWFSCQKRCNAGTSAIPAQYDFYADNGKAWEQIQRVLCMFDPTEDEFRYIAERFLRYDVAYLPGRFYALMTAKPSQIADAIIEVMKEV